MKLTNFLTQKYIKLSLMGSALASALCSGAAFADTASTTSISAFNLSDAISNVQATSGRILDIVLVVAVLVGLIFMFIGLTQIRAHFHGSAQEKHLGKGIASMVFATCLFLVIPITHALVGSIGQGSGANFTTDISGNPTVGGDGA